MHRTITTTTAHNDAHPTAHYLAPITTHTDITITGPGLQLACLQCRQPLPPHTPITPTGHATGPNATAPDGHTHTPHPIATSWVEAVRVVFEPDTDTTTVGIDLGTGGLLALTVHRSTTDGSIILTTPDADTTAHHVDLVRRSATTWTVRPLR